MLGGQRKHVPDATRFVTDKRATQYWDGLGFTIGGYRSVLSLPEPGMGPLYGLPSRRQVGRTFAGHARLLDAPTR